ncbi:MAG: enoyl-CoA hydratase/carnithine racemase [Acidimicrobiales bacterium]|jgi:enoyl-CoA hydratase|nr:enoyl-CoA hydratase/carnithine racemase [Acidimicrobiales bacterium]
MSHVDVSVDEARVAVITLVDERRRNAISLEMGADLTTAFDELERGDVRAVVITGRPPAFCAGADLGDLADADDTKLRAIYEGFLRVRRSKLPTIAAVNGPAIGAGVNLALCCDLRICGRGAVFDTRFLDIGIHPGGGASWMLQRTVGEPTANALLLFGVPVSGEEAERVGLVWQCVENDDLLTAALELGHKVAGYPPELVAMTKQTLKRVTRLESHAQALTMELDRQVWSIGKGWFSARAADRANR